MKQAQPISLMQGFSRRLFLSTALAMVLAAFFSLIITVSEFNSGLRPFLEDKARVVAVAVKGDIEYAMQIGIPFDEIRGLDDYVDELIATHPEVKGMRVIALDKSQEYAMGQGGADPVQPVGPNSIGSRIIENIGSVAATVLGQSSGLSVVTADIVRNGTNLARVEATIDETYLNGQMTSIFFDTLVILIAVSLVALEVIVVVSASQLSEPFRLMERALNRRMDGDLRQHPVGGGAGAITRFIKRLNQQNAQIRDQLAAVMAKVKESASKLALQTFGDKHFLFVTDPRSGASIMDARIPLFVFSFAEELQKSFLPLFVAEFHSESDLFARDIMMGLPISAFMFVIVVFTPFAGRLVDKFGNKTLFMTGLVPAISGYLICYLAGSANDILIGRSMTAVGYAVITISSQSYIAAVVPSENRARGMAIFVGVLMTATMCGTAIGAILADWLGYQPVFLIATGFAVLAGVLGWSMLRTDLPKPAVKAPSPQLSRSPVAVLMRNTQFVLIVLFCAIPAKVILTGVLYLFVPIYLASLDANQSEIGRIMMVYSLIIIPISPLASGFADRLGKNLWMVIGATVMSGIVLMGLYQSASVAMVLAVVAALGVVHACLKAPLIVAAMEAAEQSPDITRTGALSLLRTSERIGSVIGPVVVASLLVVLDYGQVAAIIGAVVTCLGFVMALFSFKRGKGAVHA